MKDIDKVHGGAPIYSASELRHIEKVDSKFNINFVQNHTVPADLSTPEGRAAARIGSFATNYMAQMLEDSPGIENDPYGAELYKYMISQD